MPALEEATLGPRTPRAQERAVLLRELFRQRIGEVDTTT